MHKEEHCAQNKQWEQLKGFWRKVSQMSEQHFVYICLEREKNYAITKMFDRDLF